MTHKWIAAYIYYSGDLNLLITDYLSPFINQYKHLLNQWFFIRYPEGGDHIRLRMNTIHEDEIKQHLVLENILIKYFPYEPETERYANIRLAEQHFAVSSEVIMEWICKKRGAAQIQAIRLHLLFLLSTAWPPERLLSLCEYFINDWLQIFRAKGMKERFRIAFEPQKETLFDATKVLWNTAGREQYFKKNKDIMSAYNAGGYTAQQLTIAFSSMMHMTHNRLGIENMEEAYIMYCTQACLANILSHEHH